MFILYCDRCGVRVGDHEMGSETIGDGKVICPACAARRTGRRPPVKPPLKMVVSLPPGLKKSGDKTGTHSAGLIVAGGIVSVAVLLLAIFAATNPAGKRTPDATAEAGQRMPNSELNVPLATSAAAPTPTPPISESSGAAGGLFGEMAREARKTQEKRQAEADIEFREIEKKWATKPNNPWDHRDELIEFSEKNSDTAAARNADAVIAAIKFTDDRIRRPLVRWKFDENIGSVAHDDGGMTATLKGSTSWTAGKSGFAVNIPKGIENYVDLGQSPALNIAAGDGFTISCWFKTTDKYGPILSLRNSLNDHSLIDINVGFAGGKDDRPGTLIAVTRCDELPHIPTWLLGGTVNDGTWHHMALTRRPTGKTRLYIDGLDRAAEKAQPGPITSNLRALGVELLWVQAKANTELQQSFSGQIDDFRIYKYELSSAEIEQVMTEGNKSSAAPPCGSQRGLFAFKP